MENWGRGELVPVAVIIILVGFISFVSLPKEVPVVEVPVDLGTVRIAVIDKYNSKGFPETREFYSFIADMAERDVKQYLNETGTETEFDIIFYPVEGVFETLETVMKCKKEGIDLIVGMPDGLALDQSLAYMLNNNMTFMCIGATQSFGFTIDDSCFRLRPTDVHRAGPLAETMYDMGIRKVIVVVDSFFRAVDAFQEKFHELGGEIIGQYEYDVDYGEIVDYQIDVNGTDINLNQISKDLANITKNHPSEEIAVFHIGGALPEILNLTQGYPELLNVTWVSYWGTVHQKDKLEPMGAMMSEIKMLSMVEGLAESELVERVNGEFRDEFGRDMSHVEANIYDGVWILVQSVLEESSAETTDLKERIPVVAADYVGLSGRCELDEVGDRLSFNYTIWGYAEIDGDIRYTQYGFYDWDKDQTQWIIPE